MLRLKEIQKKKSGSRGGVNVGEGDKNMKSMCPPSMAIDLFMTNFYKRRVIPLDPLLEGTAQISCFLASSGIKFLDPQL